MITQEVINKYLSKGFSVFPVNVTWNESANKFDKKPVGAWMDFMNRLATPQEVEIWTSMFEFNALGMATGKVSGVSVVDVDDPNNNHGFTSSVRVKTISGGHHFWYKYQPGVRNKAKINGIPVDIRGDGGFVVVPPSESNGKKYSWEEFDFDNMPSFPKIDVEPLYKPKITTLPTATTGSRNQTAIAVCGHIVASTKSKAWETVAWPAFLNWNENMCDPSLDESELRRTFDSACQMQTRNHPDKNPINIHTGSQIKSKYNEMMSRWGEGLSTGFIELDNWFKFLPEQLYLISSPTHQGKTTIALNMASRIASIGSKVLFCSLEQGLFIAPRIETMLGGAIPPTLSVMESASLVAVGNLVEIVNSLSERPDIIMIDHLHFMEKSVKLGTTGAIDEMMISIQNMAKTLSLPVVVISHLRKLNEERSPELDDLRDSSSLSQIPSVVMQLYRKKDDNGTIFDDGQFFIRKNRITGKTGSLYFKLLPSGEVKFIERKV